jgi:hypothetical protein
MPTTQELQAITKLRAHATRGDARGVDITYGVTGGAPGEQIDDAELRISGSGAVGARQRSAAAAPQESSDQLAEPELNALLRDLGEGLSELIPSSEARFLPDSGLEIRPGLHCRCPRHVSVLGFLVGRLG